jgi:hypothetical protein
LKRAAFMADIFISYSKKDRTLVEELSALLEECGYSVWWDTNLVAGKEFRDEIRKQIDRAFAAIVIWSRHSVRSDFVIDEADLARKQGKLISVLAGQFASDAVPLGFRNDHHVGVGEVDKLIQALAEKGKAPARPVTAYLVRLFKQRLDALTQRRSVAVLPSALAVLALAGALLGFYAYSSTRAPQAPAPRLTIGMAGGGHDGQKGYLSFYLNTSGAPSDKPIKVDNIEMHLFDRSMNQVGVITRNRPFLLPSVGYTHNIDQEYTPPLRRVLEEKGIISVCVKISFDSGTRYDRIGAAIPIEDALKQSNSDSYIVKGGLPDEPMIEALSRKTSCRYT